MHKLFPSLGSLVDHHSRDTMTLFDEQVKFATQNSECGFLLKRDFRCGLGLKGQADCVFVKDSLDKVDGLKASTGSLIRFKLEGEAIMPELKKA
jgi:hypothetical protein